jgi:hypothetical protein
VAVALESLVEFRGHQVVQEEVCWGGIFKLRFVAES